VPGHLIGRARLLLAVAL